MRSRTVWMVGLSLVGVLFLSSAVLSQEEGPGQGRRGGQGRGGQFFPRRGFGAGLNLSQTILAGIEGVQTELKLTEEQKEKIGEIRQEFMAKSREELSMRGLRDLPEEERAKKMEEMQKKREELTAATDKKIRAVLEDKQAKRLEEIWVQRAGIRALTDKVVAKKLKIKEEQTKTIAAALQWGQDEQRKLFDEIRESGRGREGFAEMREKREKIQKEVEGKILAALTEEQKKAYEGLKGEPFELQMRGGFQRGGGGGRAGGGGEGQGGQRPPRGRRPGGEDGGTEL